MQRRRECVDWGSGPEAPWRRQHDDGVLWRPGSFSEDSFSVYGQCRGKLGNVLMNFVQVRAVTGCRDRAGRGGVPGTETV